VGQASVGLVPPALHAGTVHTHVLAWKVDLDIAGTHNSLKMLDFKVRHAAGIRRMRILELGASALAW